jgi:F-box and WD-40 domain protein CDC4
VDRLTVKSTPKHAHHATPKHTHQARDLGLDRRYETPDGTRYTRSIQQGEGVKEESSVRKSKRPRSPDSLGKRPNKTQPQLSSRSERRLTPFTSSSKPKVEDLDQNESPIAGLLPTPDVSELEPLVNNNGGTMSFMTSASDSAASFEEAVSPSVIAAHTSFPSAVATPPIAETDLEPFDELTEALIHSPRPRTTLNTTATQNASLPSPSLSPTFAAANLQLAHFPVADEEELESSSSLMTVTHSGTSLKNHNDPLITQRIRKIIERPRPPALTGSENSQGPTVLDTRSMLDTFDSMPNEMKSFMMYQFLRRCPRKTLHIVADAVNPALQCDFLEELPPELSLHILGFLNHRDLCRAAQVSKRWRNIIDSNETGWKELLDRDNFILPAGELERAIKGGWGWQDPYGADGWERDLGGRPTSSDGESAGFTGSSGSSSLAADTVISRSYSSINKRKRTMGSLGLERMKRRALSQEPSDRKRSMDSRSHSMAIGNTSRSDGPNAAATAAALAVPNPHLGLSSLSKLHLFKSIYRRRYMLQRSWMSGKIQPQHIAFPAHPRHVITCLQFDEDKILTGSDDTYIHVYDTKTGKLRKRLEGHEGGVWALQYEGNVLVSGSTDRSVRVWDIEKGLCTQVFHGHTSTVRCLQILLPVDTGRSFNGKPIMIPAFPLIITGSRDSQLRVWRLPEQGAKRYIQTGPPANDADCPYFIRVLAGHTHSVRAIAAYQDTLVSGSYDNSVRVWKISTGETLHQLRGHGQKVYSVVLDHMRRRCISGSMDNTVKIWSLDTGANLYTLEGHSSLVGLLDLRDGRLVSAAADSTLRIWDPENGQCKNTLTAHTGAITCFQHDGTKVISGSDRTLKMWNVQTGECLKDLLTDLSGVWQVKFDERRCVAAVQRDSLTYIEASTFFSFVAFVSLIFPRSLTSVHLEMAFPRKTVADVFFSSLLM